LKDDFWRFKTQDRFNEVSLEFKDGGARTPIIKLRDGARKEAKVCGDYSFRRKLNRRRRWRLRRQAADINDHGRVARCATRLAAARHLLRSTRPASAASASAGLTDFFFLS